MKTEDFIVMPIPVQSFTAVCALLGGAALAASSAPSGNSTSAGADAQRATAPSSENTGGSQESGASDGRGLTVTTDASPTDGGSGEVDAHGHPWSADLHASTKGKTKDGLWRMKVGVARPAPLPGFPKDDASAGTGTSSETPTPSATSPGATDQANAPAATLPAEDDEFAAFRNAAAASDATDAAAAAAVPARAFTDADLGALCNQAAVKLGDPSPVKEIIAAFVPEGQVAHSRNIPEERRAEFVAAVEARADIKFAG